MAEVARSAISAVPVPHHPPSAFADVQHQPDGGDLNLESLLPADLTFAIEFAQPSRPSKPPAYKPTALPTQLLQPSTSAAVIPPNNPWSYDPSTESCSASTALPSATTCPSHHTTPSLQTSRSVPDRAAFSQGPYRHTSAAPVTSRVQLSPPPPPPPRGASPLSASPLPTSPSGPARTSSSSSSSVSPHQSPVHSRSGYLDYGFGTGSDGYYGGGPPPPPPPPPRDGQSPSGTPCNKNMASDNRSGSLLGKNFVRRNSAGSGYNSGPPPPPPPPPRDSQQSSFCTPLDLGSLATSAGDGAVLVTQSSRGTTTPSGAAPSDCWPPPPPPPPPPSKTGTPRTAASVMLQPPPPPPRNDDRLRSRSSSSAAVPYNNNGSYMNGYPSPVMPPPPPPPRPATSSDGQLSDGSNSDVNSTGFRAPTLQEAQMLVAAALQDGTDDSLAAALELANKLQTLAAQRIASVPNGNTRQSPPLQGLNPYGSCVVNTNRNSVPLGGGGASRGSSYPGQLSGMGSGAPPPLPPPSPLQPTESGRLANVGSGQVGLYGRGSTTPRGVYGSTVPPPPPPPPPRSPANSLLPTTGSQPMLPPPPPPPPRAPVPQSPSPEVAAVMAALPEVRSPFALYQRSSDSDYCPTPPDEPALKVDQLSHVNSTTFPAASNPAATASTASPYGNPYSGMFGSMLGTPFGAPLPGAYSGTVVGAASAFGSGAFGSEVYATPASTTVPGGCDTSQEVSLASLASLLTTLAALAKQGGSGSAVVGSGQTTLSRDAAYASGSNSATAPSTTATIASHAANVGLEAKPAAILESSSPSPQQRLSLAGGSDKGSEVEAFRSPSPPVALSSASGVASPGGSSGGSCDTMTTPGSSPSELLPINGVEDVSSKPHSPIEAATSGVASPVGEKAAAVEAHEPATAAPGTLVSSNGSGAAPIPAANCNGLSGVSLATLQQAIALLSAGFPSSATSSAPASSTFMPEYSVPNPLNVTAEAGEVGMALTAAVPLSAAVMSPSDGVTAEELQMAKSLHAALKVVALLESLSGTSCVARA